MDRLHRTRLLVGDDAINKLRRGTVMVVGVGAVGSFSCEALARSGIGHFILIDPDNVEESNINRQLFALSSTIGRPKVDVAAARIRDINPDTTVRAINMRWDATTNPDTTPDFVIDAIDDIPAKVALYRWCTAHNVPFASSMGAARKIDPTRAQIAKLSKTRVCPLAAKIRKLTRDAGLPDVDVVYSDEVPCAHANGREFGSIITVTGTFGLMLAHIAIKAILNK